MYSAALASRPSASPFSVRCSTSSGDSNEAGSRPPAEEFSPLAATFQRRLVTGAGVATLVAVGANFGGLTSALLSLVPEPARRLKLDALYPVQGYTRCIDNTNGFEFVYPAEWVGDQTVLYRSAGREESQRPLDPPPLDEPRRPRPRAMTEPVVAFGPPGSSGELNVSVIVAPVAPDFSLESMGGAKDVGEALARTLSKRREDVEASLVRSEVRRGQGDKTPTYYELELAVQSPRFRRRNVAVCCVWRGRLFTLNAQAPESGWPAVQEAFYTVAGSFTVTT